MILITRRQALSQNLPRYFTGKPCKRNHVSERLTSNRNCIACDLFKKKLEYDNNTEYKLKSLQRRKDADTPALRLARVRLRQARKLQRTPAWLTEEHHNEMKAMFTLAKQLEQQYNKKMHVDHIVPLVNKRVSGLHVPWNLQILTWKENLEKSNKFDI